MPFLVSDENLPAILTAEPMTDEEFVAFCAQHPDLNFEMTAEGELIVMAPTYSETGARNSVVGARLLDWAIQDGRGIVCDSSAGFVLPNGARRSPDASWTIASRVEELGEGKRKKFWHLCPDFIIRSEIRQRPIEGAAKKDAGVSGPGRAVRLADKSGGEMD